MYAKIEQCLTMNPNPVLSVAKDGTVIYSNEAGEPLLQEWRVAVGEKLPSYIVDIVHRALSQQSPINMEVNVGNKVYFTSLYHFQEDKCVNIYAFDISDQKEFKEKIPENEVPEATNVEFAEIIDVPAVQSLMDDFYKLAHVPMSLDDLKGKVLVGVGWQDICTKFHRVHPDTCKHCIESSTQLSKGVPTGEFKVFRCKNNMWDIATPVMMSDQHVGNIFSGQFFFDDEPLDYDFFRSQAKKYGFNEEEYMAALEKVPRMSRKAVETGISFLMKFANLLSELSYSNTMLAKSLSERDELVTALQESEKRERARSDELAAVLDAVPAFMLITHDPQALEMTGNRISHEWLRLPEDANLSKAALEGKRPETYKLFKDGVEIPLAKMPLRLAASGIEVCDYEFDIAYTDGTMRHLLGDAIPLRDDKGNARGAIAAFIDITKRREAEEKLRESEEKYRNIVETANEGIFLMNAEFKITFANNRTAELLGYTQGEIIGRPVLDFISEENKPVAESRLKKRQLGISESYELKLKCKDSSPFWAFISAKPLFNKYGDFAGSLSMFTDISKLKNTETRLKETLENLENLIRKRTSELKKAYECLKKSESGLSEAQKMAHIGNWERSFATGKLHWSDEMYLIFRLQPQEVVVTTDLFYHYVHPDDREYVKNAVEGAFNGKPFSIENRIILANREERIVHARGEVVFDEKYNPVRLRGITQDITERKKAEKALQESEQRLQNILDGSPNIIFVKDLEGRFLLINKKLEGLLGIMSDEIKGKTDFDIFPPELADYYRKHDQKVLETGVSKQVEEISDLVDGRHIFLANKFPLYDIQGKTYAICGISTDITERTKAENDLQKSEEQYRILFNSMNEGFCIVEMIFDENEKPIDYFFVETNPAFGKQTGFGNVVGRRVRELIPSNEEYWYEKYGKVALTGESARFDNYVEGLNRWYEVYAYRIGQPVNRKVAIIFNDITERKIAEEKVRESEEKYRNIVETANEGIALISSEGIITFVNEKMADMIGYTVEEGIGKPIWDFLSEDSISVAKLNVEKRLNGVDNSYELQLIKKDGSLIWVLINEKSLLDQRGKYIGSLTMLTDVTKRKENEKALAEIEIARKKEIHHRIKNNLQVISSLLDLQADKFRNRKNINYSEVLEAFKESQDRIVSMALIHEELYKGGGLEKLNFSPYVEELAENLLHTYSLGNNNISIRLNLEENTFFDMDIAVPLGMIINELVSNSFKHAFKGKNEGEIQIILLSEEIESYFKNIKGNCESTSFALKISDNGIGIPVNLEIEALDSLGLQLVSSLVAQLDGELEIKRNNGTEFIIRFTVTEKNNQMPLTASPQNIQIVNKT